MLLVCLSALGCATTSSPCPICDLHHEHASDTEGDFLRAEDVEWTALNPARGDRSPQAANLWGDRAEDGATGFMVKFVDGFSSPPHIHNVTYRGVVLEGEVHNDDPTAATMWMPKGSFWTQPAGEVHITSARGRTNIAYIEIDSGPYLVHPPDQAFDQGERPVNVHDSNLVWIRDSNLVWIQQELGIKIAYLWGSPDDGKPYGLMMKVPKGFNGLIRYESGPFRAIVVDGAISHQYDKNDQPALLAAGSYLGTSLRTSGGTSLNSQTGAVLYIRAQAALELMAE
ncbi:MAG: DUF4437 domain-containing protein [Planctomycetota bacterium]